MIVMYLRVSTGKQCTKTQDFSLREYARKKGYKVVEYMDFAVSGKNTDRDGFQRMMADARAGRIKKILVFEQSRLSRDFVDGLNIMAELTSLDVEVETPEGVVKFDSGIEKLVASIKSFTAQAERENIAERTKAGMARAKAEGKPIGFPAGKPHPRKGHRKDYRKEDPDTYDRILRMSAKGNTCRAIAEMLGGITHQKVHRIIKSSK